MNNHLFIFLFTLMLLPSATWAFLEEPLPEALLEEWKPLQVTEDAISWDVFATTKEHEECTEDEEGYTACIVKPEYSEAVQQLNGQEVTLMGYIFPLEQSQKQKNFLIGPYPLSCPFHYHVGPTQMVEVLADKPVDFSYDPIKVKGILRVRYNEETGMFFYLEQSGQS